MSFSKEKIHHHVFEFGIGLDVESLVTFIPNLRMETNRMLSMRISINQHLNQLLIHMHSDYKISFL